MRKGRNLPFGWPNDCVHINGLVYQDKNKVETVEFKSTTCSTLEIFFVDKDSPAYQGPGKGRGVRATEDIPGDVTIGFYAGVYRPISFAPTNPYLFDVGDDFVIDALGYGNITRFINDPITTVMYKGPKRYANVESVPVKFVVGKTTFSVIEIKTLPGGVKAGEELLMNYHVTNKNYWGPQHVKIIDITGHQNVVVKMERFGDEQRLTGESVNSIETEKSEQDDVIHPVRTKRLKKSQKTEQTEPIKQTKQTKQTELAKKAEQTKQTKQTKQTEQTKQTKQTKQTELAKKAEQTKQTKQTEQTKQTKQTKQTEQSKKTNLSQRTRNSQRALKKAKISEEIEEKHDVEAEEHDVEAGEHDVEAEEHDVEAEEHDVEAEEHDVEAEAIKKHGLSEVDILTRLTQAENEFESIKGLHIDTIEVEGPPDIDALIQNTDLSELECLCEMSSALSSLDGRFSVVSWWKIVKRSCQIYGIFELLRSQKSKKNMRYRYDTLIKELHGNGLKYAQASNYKRLGKFLSKFPAFVFQRQWANVADWFQKVAGRDAVLLDCITSIATVSSVFLRDAFSLHKHGVQVHSGLMKEHISDMLVDSIMERVSVKGVPIFNNHAVDSRLNDKKRLNLDFDSIKIKELCVFKQTLINFLAVRHPDHNIVSMVAQLSKDGCAPQLAHTLCSPSDVFPNDNHMPLGCLIALTETTMFDIWPRAIRFDGSDKIKPMTIKLSAGDVLMFRGDLVHASSSVTKANVKLFAHLNIKGKSMEGSAYMMNNKQYILERKHSKK